MPAHAFIPKDFADYNTYEKNAIKLEQTQRLYHKIFNVWISLSGMIEKDTPLFCEIASLLDNAVQIGYEAALDMPHKASDYDIDRATVIGYENQCDFCKHQYFVYNCEEECARENKGFPCDLDVKEYLD